MIGAVLKIALRALARNKGRSALTMLGIIIGAASVIAMVGLGQGAQQQVQQQIESMGTNMLIISAGSQRTGGVRSGAGTGTTLTPEDLEAILRDAPAVSAISPSVSAPVTLIFGNGNWSTRAEGVAPSNFAIRNRAVGSGEMFTEADVRSAARVAVMARLWLASFSREPMRSVKQFVFATCPSALSACLLRRGRANGGRIRTTRC